MVPLARADYLQLPNATSSVVANRVILRVDDPDDKTSRTWTSDTYNSISDVTSSGGIIAFSDEDSGEVRFHAIAYDPGDRKWHTWESSRSSSFSQLSNSGGRIACIDDEAGQIMAAAYDPADRSWHKWTSSAYAKLENFSMTDGIVAATANSGQYAVAAAYDIDEHQWETWKTGSSSTTAQSDLTNKGGIVALLSAGKVVAKAYDPGDHSWHSWTDSSADDKNLATGGGIVAFSKKTVVYALVYDAGEQKWTKWTNDTHKEITAVTVSGGVVSYTYGGVTYNHSMSVKPNADFTAIRTDRADSMLAMFVDGSFGEITSWQWDFGDGGKSTRRSAFHVYAKPGDYKVTLKVTGPGGTDSKTSTIAVATPTYTLTYAAGANGTLGGTTPQSVKFGASGTTVTANPAAGYHLAKWSDGATTNPRRRDTAVKKNISATASFAINQYTINFKTDGTPGARLTGTCCQKVNHGLNCTSVTAVAPTGWKFVKWSNGVAVYSLKNPLTVAKVTANMTIAANFARKNASTNWQFYR